MEASNTYSVQHRSQLELLLFSSWRRRAPKSVCGGKKIQIFTLYFLFKFILFYYILFNLSRPLRETSLSNSAELSSYSCSCSCLVLSFFAIAFSTSVGNETEKIECVEVNNSVTYTCYEKK